MDVEFEDGSLEQMEGDPHYRSKWPAAIVRAFRKRMNFIRKAADERDLRAWKSLHYEKLKGRRGQRSLKLNDQWRLVIEPVGSASSRKVRIIGIEDYH